MKQNKGLLIFMAFGACISHVPLSDAGDLGDNCQKFQNSDPLKRFVLKLWDIDDGIDQNCARDLEIKQSFNQLDIQHMNEELVDIEFRKQANKAADLYRGKSNTTITNGSKIQAKKSTQDMVTVEEIAIDTVEGFQTVK